MDFCPSCVLDLKCRKIQLYQSDEDLTIFSDPSSTLIQVYRPDRPVEIFGGDDVWEVADVLPGFQVPVRQFFE